MKIKRGGAVKFQGPGQIEFGSPSFTWDKSDSTLLICQGNVKDFNPKTRARHDYEVRITNSELNEILITVAAEAMSNPASFEKCLEGSLKAILQLQHVASGLQK